MAKEWDYPEGKACRCCGHGKFITQTIGNGISFDYIDIGYTCPNCASMFSEPQRWATDKGLRPVVVPIVETEPDPTGGAEIALLSDEKEKKDEGIGEPTEEWLMSGFDDYYQKDPKTLTLGQQKQRNYAIKIWKAAKSFAWNGKM